MSKGGTGNEPGGHGRRRAIIHIGTEKTGTRTIQEYLHINRKELVSSGVAYLGASRTKNNIDLATCCMDSDQVDDRIMRLGLQDPERRRAWRDGYRRQFEQELAAVDQGVHAIICSSEHFHSRLRTLGGVSNLRALLRPWCSAVAIIVYLRRQDQLATSLYSTALRAGWSPAQIIPTVDGNDPYYNYEILLSLWASVFGRDAIRPRVFERERLVAGDLLTDFLDACELSHLDPVLRRPPNKNKSLSALSAEVVKCFNLQRPPFPDDQADPLRDMRFRLIAILETTHPGKPLLPRRADAQRFYLQFRESNDRVARKWFDGTLFQEDFGAYPFDAMAPSITVDEVMKDITRMLSELATRSHIIPRTPLVDQIDESCPDHEIFRRLAMAFKTVNPELASLLDGRAHRLSDQAIIPSR